MISMYIALRTDYGVLGSAAVVGTGCLSIALFSVWVMRETFDKDLDYNE